jgi:hypothetical protein
MRILPSSAGWRGDDEYGTRGAVEAMEVLPRLLGSIQQEAIGDELHEALERAVDDMGYCIGNKGTTDAALVGCRAVLRIPDCPVNCRDLLFERGDAFDAVSGVFREVADLAESAQNIGKVLSCLQFLRVMTEDADDRDAVRYSRVCKEVIGVMSRWEDEEVQEQGWALIKTLYTPI